MEFFDTHAHLGDAQFSEDREAVLTRAAEAGVAHIVEIADSPDEWEAAVRLSRARPHQVRCTLGLHPYYSDKFSDEMLSSLEKKIRLPEVVGVGEIGLDYVKSEVPRDIQRSTLERMLAACKGWDAPVVVHCRGAYEDLVGIISRLFPAKHPRHRFWGVIHCFSGNAEEAVLLSGLGFALGADGPVTYKKNDALREAFLKAGPDCLVLETDSPYLPPQSTRGKRNEPASIPEIAAKLSEVLGLSLEDLAQRTTANAFALYRMKPLSAPSPDRPA